MHIAKVIRNVDPAHGADIDFGVSGTRQEKTGENGEERQERSHDDPTHGKFLH